MTIDRRAVRLALLCALVVAGSAQAVDRTVFVTSVSGTGDFSTWGDTNLDGAEGADEICQARAAAGGLANAGTYRAWISTGGDVGSADAWCHLFGETGTAPDCNGAGPNPHAMGPWDRTDALKFSGDLEELTGSQQKVIRPLLLNEFGNVVPAGTEAWTGTYWNGAAVFERCSNWSSASGTGVYGVVDTVGSGWTYWAGDLCSESRRLICFEPGVGTYAPLHWREGALAFTTSTEGSGDLSSWAETNLDGLDGADEVCQVRAAAAHLPGASTFFALLSTGAVDAMDRITYPGPYVRVDGILVASLKSQLFTGDLVNAMNVTELEQYLGSGPQETWTGTANDGTAAADRCSEWAGTGSSGVRGETNVRDSRWLSSNPLGCGSSFRLFCFTNQETLFWDNFERGDTSRWTNGTL